jgi:hypothetical protein
MSAKSKVTATLAAIAVFSTIAAGTAQAKHKFHGPAFGFGIATGLILGAAAASAYPGYVVEPSCGYVEKIDKWGNLKLIKVCTPY